jgi:hypothetical protein
MLPKLATDHCDVIVSAVAIVVSIVASVEELDSPGFDL